MSKTKPIGVRFDEELLSELKEKGLADSPQKAVNYLTGYYRERQGLNGAINHMEELPVSKVQGSVTKEDLKEIANAFFVPTGEKAKSDKKILEKAQAEINRKFIEGDKSAMDDTIKKQQEVLAKIDAIKAEKIPPERNTQLGRGYWQQEQNKRILELKKQL